MPNPRKPKLTPRRRERIRQALLEATEAQTLYWNSLGALEGAVGFDFCMDDKDLEHYDTTAFQSVEAFIAAAWQNRDGQ